MSFPARGLPVLAPTRLVREIALLLSWAGGGMRPPMGAGGMQSTEDDEFSIRPTSRGARMGSRGPLAPVNVATGFSQPGGMTKEGPVQISQTEQDLARNGIDTVFDPTARSGSSSAGLGPGAPGAGGIGNPTMGLAPRMDTSDIRGLLTRVPPPNTTVQCYIVRKKGAMVRILPHVWCRIPADRARACVLSIGHVRIVQAVPAGVCVCWTRSHEQQVPAVRA
jgi:hypothetical protein